MGTNQIGREAFCLEMLSSTGTTLSTNDLGFCFYQQMMKPLGVSAIEAVTKIIEILRNSTTAVQFINAKCPQVMLPLLGQALNDVDVLPWKILMNEKNSH